MSSPVSNILRQAIRKANEPLNILVCPTHERYEVGLASTGHSFYAIRDSSVKDWNSNYAALPDNYTLLDSSKGNKQVPRHVEFDLVLSQNKFGQYQILSKLATEMNLPLISLEHTLPVLGWDIARRESLRDMQGHYNVFISDYSVKEWGFSNIDHMVIHHMVDQDIFHTTEDEDALRPNVLLSVVNDWVNRDHCCNFKGWQRITQGLPVNVLGDTPGLSQPAPSTKALADTYRASSIFVNTSTISPIPTAMLEAMSCGAAIVSTATCMIPDIIQHGINGLISNDEAELREFCELLLNDQKLARELGKAAVNTVRLKFGKERFVNEWESLFRQASNRF